MPSRSPAERPRRAGVLLHITSLPGPYGIGDIGPMARRFVDWLDAAGQRIWQVLPVHPTDDHGSPYSSPSAFARHPLLLSVDDLVSDGWLTHADKPFGAGSPYRVDVRAVSRSKWRALTKAADRVGAEVDLDAWATTRPWVRSWSRYAALSAVHGGDWARWPDALRHRDADALAQADDVHQAALRRHTALQWLFAGQWARLREAADARGIALWGDLPFFVGGASCDVWAHPHLFRLDAEGRPSVVTGVPPDAFSATGQRWGQPHYAMDAHVGEGFAWWGARLEAELELFHEVRLDHFRGVAGVWEIPADGEAVDGQWVPGFGAPLLEALRARLGGLPLIAEDLGIITPDVVALRDAFDLPGMVVLQFAFEGVQGGGAHPYLPHNHRPEQVVYPGTHDNPTAWGWWEAADEVVRDHVRRYLSCDGRDPSGELARAAWRSVAADAVVPMQDLLGLGADARMNTPGLAEGNWAWRGGPEVMSVDVAGWLRMEAKLTGRA